MLARTYRPRLYRTSRWVLLALFKLFHRLRVQGSHHVPQTGGCLLASNHASFMDPPALSCAIKHRVVRFMARDTLFKEGLRSWFMHGVAAFPISRERGDVGALKKCIQLLKGGDCVGIFPEGTRTRDGELGAGQTRHWFFDHGRRCAGGPCVYRWDVRCIPARCFPTQAGSHPHPFWPAHPT
jgi:1-acyl-sn-glycerol-3-phosphate acyltransferase